MPSSVPVTPTPRREKPSSVPDSRQRPQEKPSSVPARRKARPRNQPAVPSMPRSAALCTAVSHTLHSTLVQRAAFLGENEKKRYRGQHFSARTRKNGAEGSIPRRRARRGGTGGVISRHTTGGQVQGAAFLGAEPGRPLQPRVSSAPGEGASALLACAFGAAAGRARRTSVTAWLEGARRGTRAARGCGRRGCRAASSQCWSGRGAPAPRAGRRPPQAGASRSCVARCGGAAP